MQKSFVLLRSYDSFIRSAPWHIHCCIDQHYRIAGAKNVAFPGEAVVRSLQQTPEGGLRPIPPAIKRIKSIFSEAPFAGIGEKTQTACPFVSKLPFRSPEHEL
jgi:hypothetical protein